MPENRRSIWLIRALLMSLLLFGSEVLFWNNLPAQNVGDTILRVIGYGLLSIIILDLFVRFRVYDIWGGMFVLGVYAMLHSLLVMPSVTLENAPQSLISIGLGAQWQIGMQMVGIFIVFLASNQPRVKWVWLIGMGIVGFSWGAWMRWLPVFNPESYSTISLSTALLYATVSFAIVILLFALVRRTASDIAVDDFKLSIRELSVWGLAAMLLFLFRVLQGSIDGLSLVLIAILSGICILLLWFRGDTKQTPLLHRYFPMRPLSWAWLIAGIISFVAVAIFTWSLPLIDPRLPFNQLTIITLAFSGIGIGWLPFVAGVLGMRFFTRQMRVYQKFQG